MANSFSFNAVDMTDYGLVVTSAGSPFTQSAPSIQLRDRSYAFDSFRPPRIIVVGVQVKAATHTALRTALDSIKEKLNWRVDKQLIFDNLSTRYWMARFNTMQGMFEGPLSWSGSIEFTCVDPAAYSTSAVSNTYNVDADPDTNVETPGGNDYIYPIYTLTAGEVLAAITLLVENVTTDEELTWEGSVGNGKLLVINTATWLVTNDGTADMDDVSGKFPRLQPGVANSIKVTDFSTTGTLNIAYRNRFL